MKYIFVAIFIVVTSGCSANRIWFGADKPRLSYVTLEGHPEKKEDGHFTGIKVAPGSEAADNPNTPEKHIGTVISWSPEFNAAFMSAKGRGCIQPAAYARTHSGGIKLPSQIVGGTEGSIDAAYAQALEKLAAVTNQSTFLSIGFYGICQLQANGALEDESVEKLVKIVVENAAAISNSVNDKKSVSAAQ